MIGALSLRLAGNPAFGLTRPTARDGRHESQPRCGLLVVTAVLPVADPCSGREANDRRQQYSTAMSAGDPAPSEGRAANPALVDRPLPDRVLLIEDHALLAQSLTLALRTEGIVAEPAPTDSRERILDAAYEGGYALILLDLDLDGRLGSGLSLIKPLQGTGARVVMLTGVDDRERLAECVKEGAVGLVSTRQRFDQLLEALRDAMALGSLLRPDQRDELLAELRRQRKAREDSLVAFERLTHREKQVLAALMEGHTAGDVASEWIVEVSTVRSHIRSLLLKLGVNSQIAAIAMAHRAGWSPPKRD